MIDESDREGLPLPRWEKEVYEILGKLSNGPAWQVHCFECVDSTMDVGRMFLPNVTPESPAVVLTQSQSQGRGRQGRVWQEPREGLFASFIFAADSGVDTLSGLSLVIGCAIHEVLGSESCEVYLKWPNDILSVDGRKIAGVLIELVSHQGQSFAIIGIGVNLVGAPSAVTDSASVLDVCGKRLTAPELTGLLCPVLYDHWQKFLRESFVPFRTQWETIAYRLDSEITIDTGTEIIRGIVRGVSASGALRLETSAGIRELVAGHVVG